SVLCAVRPHAGRGAAAGSTAGCAACLADAVAGRDLATKTAPGARAQAIQAVFRCVSRRILERTGHGEPRRVNAWIWPLALLPLAFASGWWLHSRHSRRASGAAVSRLSTTYFRGLNYLLNEQPDKAIEVFLKIAEVDRETVETHFALGHLFRDR